MRIPHSAYRGALLRVRGTERLVADGQLCCAGRLLHVALASASARAAALSWPLLLCGDWPAPRLNISTGLGLIAALPLRAPSSRGVGCSRARSRCAASADRLLPPAACALFSLLALRLLRLRQRAWLRRCCAAASLHVRCGPKRSTALDVAAFVRGGGARCSAACSPVCRRGAVAAGMGLGHDSSGARRTRQSNGVRCASSGCSSESHTELLSLQCSTSFPAAPLRCLLRLRACAAATARARGAGGDSFSFSSSFPPFFHACKCVAARRAARHALPPSTLSPPSWRWRLKGRLRTIPARCHGVASGEVEQRSQSFTAATLYHQRLQQLTAPSRPRQHCTRWRSACDDIFKAAGSPTQHSAWGSCSHSPLRLLDALLRLARQTRPACPPGAERSLRRRLRLDLQRAAPPPPPLPVRSCAGAGASSPLHFISPHPTPPECRVIFGPAALTLLAVSSRCSRWPVEQQRQRCLGRGLALARPPVVAAGLACSTAAGKSPSTCSRGWFAPSAALPSAPSCPMTSPTDLHHRVILSPSSLHQRSASERASVPTGSRSLTASAALRASNERTFERPSVFTGRRGRSAVQAGA